MTLAWIAGIALRSRGPAVSLATLGMAARWRACLHGDYHLSLAEDAHTGGAGRTFRADPRYSCSVRIAFGAARAAWTDPASDPHAISHLPLNTPLRLRGEVAAEPDIRGGYALPAGGCQRGQPGWWRNLATSGGARQT